MKFEALLEERLSKKSGKTYKCLVVRLTNTVEKVIFLDPSEIELLELKYGKKTND